MQSSLKYFLLTCSIFISLAFISGDDFVEQLQTNLNFHYSSNVPVKLHLFHNQPQYAPGDTLFFKATMVTEAEHHLLGERAVIEVRLKDTNGKLKSDQKALLKNGLGAGYLIIPDSVKGGIYELEAFNSWMKNYPSSFFFHKKLTISGKNKFSSRASVSFYPEGGKFINGVTNKVVVKGTPLSAGSILSNDGKRVADFTVRESGLSSFYLTPREGLTYFYTIDGSAQIQFPVKTEEGINILTTGVEEKQLKFVVQNSTANKLKEAIHVIVWHHNQIVYGAKLSFKRKDGHIIQVPKENIPEGVSGITVFTSTGEVLAERLFYIKSTEGDAIQIAMASEQFQVRESVNAELTLNKEFISANLAVSVFQDDLFKSTSGQNNIHTYLNLSSEVPDEFFGQLTNPTDVDLFMITQPWKRFDWGNVMKKTTLDSYQMDSKLSLRGTAYFADTGDPIPGSVMLKFLMKNDLMNYETRTKDHGLFSFPLLLDFSGANEVFYQAYIGESRLKNVKIDFNEDNPSDAMSAIPVEVEANDPHYQFYKDRKEIADVFLMGAEIPADPQLNGWAKRILTFVNKEDLSIDLREYLAFPTLRETIHEIIPNLKARNGKNGEYVRLTINNPDRDEKEQNQEATQDPVYIIDGVLTESTAYFLSIQPKDVVSIKLITSYKKLAQLGMEQSGVVLVETSIPDHYKKIPSEQSVFSFNGFNEKSKFSMVQASAQRPRIPDIRSCLFWHPQVKLDNEKSISFSFQTPDNTGTFRIVVDGITSTGKPVHQEKTFKVAFGQ